MSCTGCCFRGRCRDLHTWVYLSLQKTCQDNYIHVHKMLCFRANKRDVCFAGHHKLLDLFSAEHHFNCFFNQVLRLLTGIWYFVSNCPPFFLLQQAALVLNASRRFRYTLDLKREEQREEVISKIRAQAHVVRVNIITFFCFFFP